MGSLVALSHAMVWWVRYDRGSVTLAENIAAYGPMMVLFLYLPATLMVLRRPNEGTLPVWLEERVKRWPAWIQGTA